MNRSRRIGVITYPILFQTIGGLQIQVWETVAALQRAGHDARLFDSVREKFTDFELLHVFGSGAGNQTIVQQARDLDVPVVLSPLISACWDRRLALRARIADGLVGRLTGWEVSTSYRQLHRGVHLASHCVALGKAERRSLTDAFGVPPEQVSVVPNGIPARFFEASGELALRHFNLRPGFVLCVASIDQNKNQLGLARALQGLRRDMVMVGQCMPANRDYLAQVLAIPGTRHLGPLRYEDPLLPSLYAAAGVFCLASFSEVMPLVVLEALAAGTPAVMTSKHSMDTDGMHAVLREVEPTDGAAIARAVSEFAGRPPGVDQCRKSVSHLTWDAVAASLSAIYRRLTVRMLESQTTGNPP